MDLLGAALYLILLALLLMFWLKGRGHSLDDLLDRNEHLHHHVHRVIGEHPSGGTFKQHRQWMKETTR